MTAVTPSWLPPPGRHGKEPKVRNQRALGIRGRRRARSRFPPGKARVTHSAATGSSGKTAPPSPGGFKARRVLSVPSALVSQAGQGVLGTGKRGQRAAPADLGGAVPQTAVILAVTRNFSSTLLNFAAHSPEDTNATENTVLRAFNRPDRRHRSSTERRLHVRVLGADQSPFVTCWPACWTCCCGPVWTPAGTRS